MAPDPRPRRHRGHRKGVEPAGLRRWRLSHKRHKADPRPRRHRSRRWKAAFTGPRAGRYWQGPHKRRYDPQPKHRFGRVRKVGSKLENGLARYGTLIGSLIAGAVGVKQGMDSYNIAYGSDAANRYIQRITGQDGRPAEVTHIWAAETYQGGVPGEMGPLQYLRYKILGQDLAGNQTPSAWVAPLWGGIAAFICGFILKRVPNHTAHRIGRILEPIGKGATVVSAFGACALPGCPDATGREMAFPKGTQPAANTARTIAYTYQG